MYLCVFVDLYLSFFRYGTAYAQEKLSAEALSAWSHSADQIDSAIHLPEENKFIAEDFSIHADTAKNQAEKETKTETETAAAPNPMAVPGGVPSLILNAPGIRLWHHLDTQFRIPKASINVRYFC